MTEDPLTVEEAGILVKGAILLHKVGGLTESRGKLLEWFQTILQRVPSADTPVAAAPPAEGHGPLFVKSAATIRDEWWQFARYCEDVLAKHDEERGDSWKDMGLGDLLDRLREEVEELMHSTHHR